MLYFIMALFLSMVGLMVLGYVAAWVSIFYIIGDKDDRDRWRR